MQLLLLTAANILSNHQVMPTKDMGIWRIKAIAVIAKKGGEE